MYVMKLGVDKSLTTTIHAKIYQGEKNADTLVFLAPKKYENTNLADCDLMLRYILPSGYGKSEELEMEPIPYNDNYYRYHLKVTTELTEVPGEIELWLTAIDMNDNVILKSDTAEIEIWPAKNISDYFSPDDLDQLDRLSAQVEILSREKADGLTYDEDQRHIQLTADGVPVGNIIVVPSDDFNEDAGEDWGDMDDSGSSGKPDENEPTNPDDGDDPVNPNPPITPDDGDDDSGDDSGGSGDDIYWEPM